MLEACQSGSFLPPLAAPKRVLLASASKQESAQFGSGGSTFSSYFWNAVKRGSDLRAAFEQARLGVDNLSSSFSPQTPQADGDGDGRFSPLLDLPALAGRCINRCTGYANDPPAISGLVEDRILNGETSAPLWAEVNHLAPLLGVSAEILPPDHRLGGSEVPLTDLPEVALGYNSESGRWEGVYNAFEAEGDYLISFRATDTHYEVSLPRTAVLTQDRPVNSCSPDAEDWVHKAYVAYYGRPADPTGLDYWACRMDDEGRVLASILDAFGTSAEYDQRFGGLDSATLINNIYLNLFNRDADAAGLDWYRTQLDSGTMTLQSIALDILGGAQALDAAIIANKLAVAEHFTRQVRAGCAYGADEIEALVEQLRQVDGALFSVDNAKQAIDASCGS